jgi:hypothetical protein
MKITKKEIIMVNDEELIAKMELSSKEAIKERNIDAKYKANYHPVKVNCLICGKEIVMDLAYIMTCVPHICDDCSELPLS